MDALWVLLAAAVGAWLWWRWTSVSRGARRRDRWIAKELDPVMRRVDAGEAVAPEEIDAVAARDELRALLMLAMTPEERARHLGDRFQSREDIARAALAYWLMHPNESGRPPRDLRLLADRPAPSDPEASYLVFAFTDGASGRAETGVVGPVPREGATYDPLPPAFSRGDGGAMEAEALVAWFDRLGRRGRPAR